MRVVNGDSPDQMCVGALLIAAILDLLDNRITYG